jgi:ABC-type phosphate transport system permease subunit
MALPYAILCKAFSLFKERLFKHQVHKKIFTKNTNSLISKYYFSVLCEFFVFIVVQKTFAAASFFQINILLFLKKFNISNINYSNLCIANPERNFGSNQVVFGGIMLPVSAIFISCFIETG